MHSRKGRRKTKASVKFICIVDKKKNKYKIVKPKEKLSVLNSEKKKAQDTFVFESR